MELECSHGNGSPENKHSFEVFPRRRRGPTIGDEKLSGEQAEPLVSRHWNLMETLWHQLSDIKLVPATAELQHCGAEV